MFAQAKANSVCTPDAALFVSCIIELRFSCVSSRPTVIAPFLANSFNEVQFPYQYFLRDFETNGKGIIYVTKPSELNMLELLVIFFMAMFISGVISVLTFFWWAFIIFLCVAFVCWLWRLATGQTS